MKMIHAILNFEKIIVSAQYRLNYLYMFNVWYHLDYQIYLFIIYLFLEIILFIFNNIKFIQL